MNSIQDIWQWIPNYDPSGSGQPYHYQNPTSIQYRFVNDFSNKLTQTPQPFTYLNDGYQNWIIPNFDPGPITGDGLMNGYNSYNQELAGSRHIEYIPNVYMLPGASHYNARGEKFYEPTAQGFQRRGSTSGGTELENSFNNQIGGYKITNESGVTYHYMLPAYSGNEYIYTRANGDDGTFNMQQKSAYYAYAWYLTGVTGPDYVDANNDGIIDEGDWGYWVSFEYGKWCDSYIWRNPEAGYQKDLDNSFESQSAGQKELYYLNKVKTATQSAIFVKGVRYDGKGVSSNITPSQHGNYPLYNGGFDATSKSTLSLNSILLLNNADADALSTGSGSVSGHYAQNVFDASDIPGNINGSILRSIRFNYDYSLCPGTINSYDYSNVSNLFGKLTLTSVAFNGKGGASIMPPVSFNYEGDPADVKSGSVVVANNTGAMVGTIYYSGNTIFSPGDILKLSLFGSVIPYYCVVTSIDPSNSAYTVSYLNYAPLGTLPATAVTTKNPPYNKDAYDSWNMYKCDYNPANAANGENAARATTLLSAQSYDAWSLHSITSTLGARILIRYEADTYQNAVLDQGYKIQIYNDPDPAYFYNSNTDNMIYYVVRNPEIFDRPNLHVGDRFDAVLLWYDYGGQYCQEVEGVSVIDTKDITDCYLEVGDLSRFDSQGIIGFRFNNVLNFNSFPLTCARMPFFANLRNPYVNVNHYGGNLRVRSIASYNASDGQIKQTSYNYNSLANPALSSGVTTYEPTVFDDANFTYPTSPELLWGTDDTRKLYRKKLYTYNSQFISMTRELPPPGVMYEYVNITNQVLTPGNPNLVQVEGSTTYQFEVFTPSMLGIEELSRTGPDPYPGNPNPSYNTIETRILALKNFTTGIGNVKDIIRYDAQGKKLTETISHYLSDGLENQSLPQFDARYHALLPQYKQQGVMQENYTNIRYVILSNDIASYGGQRKAVNSTREEYPAIMTGQTVIDYKKNTTSTSQNLAFDFYSGALTQKLDIDVYGNRVLSQTTPAYRVYPEMGLRLNGLNNKNMLTQEAGDYTYKVDANNTPLGVISASAQVWGKSVDVANPSFGIVKQDGSVAGNGLVWRKQAYYAWAPPGSSADGITPNVAFTDFNWSAPSSSVNSWKKTAETTLFDTYSHELEGKDINGSYSTAHMAYGSGKVELAGSPCNYYEIAYSGAEDGGINQPNAPFVQRADGVVTSAAAHTGVNSLQLGPSGQKGFVYSVSTDKLVAGRNYTVAVWVKPVTGSTSNVILYYDVNGVVKGSSLSSGSSTRMAGGWTLIDLVISKDDIIPGATLNVGCRNDDPSLSAYVDDMRFQPVSAATTAYVYDPFSGELNYILNNNDLFTKFEYDAMGRLVKTYKETFSRGTFLVSQNIYNYGAGPKFTNAAINQGFAKNDCPAASQGGPQMLALIRVPAGMFTANTQADADALALAYAQSQANQRLTCPLPPPPPVYAKLFTQFVNNTDDGCMTTDFYNVYVGFYQDAACTIPATVSSLTVTFTQGDIGGGVNLPQSIFCNGTQQEIADDVAMDSFDYCYFHSMSHFFQLDPGNGYIIVP